MTKILSESQLRRLSDHKYSVTGESFLEPYLQPFWRWLVEQIPLWVAPNLLTITGLITNIVTTMFILQYNQDCKSKIPAWCLILAAVGLFIYQSLDAIDGKQARRTKSSSPLGELFDHGCDSVSMVFVSLGSAAALNLGNEPRLLMMHYLASLVVFYCAHWETFVSGTMKFGKIDVTEGQLAVIVLYILTACFGTSFWDRQIFLFDISLRYVCVAGSFAGFSLHLWSKFTTIFMEGGIGKNKSTVAGSSTVFPLIPLGIVVAVAVVVAYKSPSNLYGNHPVLYLIAFGLLTAKITNRLVVANMSRTEMDLWDAGMFGPAALMLNQYFDILLNEYTVLWLCTAVVSLDLCRYSCAVCSEISHHLGIHCFRITSKAHEDTGRPSVGPSNVRRQISACSGKSDCS